MDLTTEQWKSHIYTMLAFCVAGHIGTVAFLIAKLAF